MKQPDAKPHHLPPLTATFCAQCSLLSLERVYFDALPRLKPVGFGGDVLLIAANLGLKGNSFDLGNRKPVSRAIVDFGRGKLGVAGNALRHVK
jgi:hypothetical protein